MFKRKVEQAEPLEVDELVLPLSEEVQDFILESRKAGRTIFLDIKDEEGVLKIKSEKMYRTTNYALAAFLILKGFELQDIVFDIPFIPQKGVFLFDACPEIEESANDFSNNCTNASIQGFIQETNKLKHLIEDRMNRRGVYKYGYRGQRDDRRGESERDEAGGRR